MGRIASLRRAPLGRNRRAMLTIRPLPSGWDNNGRQLQWRQSRRAGRRPSERSTMLGSITHGASCALINASGITPRNLRD
jgi:hypothetical protein